ncbi:CD209 antigen-like protein E [Pungitius pungitius]|uniref:CD209 antigen-like protein E n=1 Tax=Pungitius pungitius TaxID=134920 RepID=UPI002E109A44
MALSASSKSEKLYRLVGVSVGLLCMLQAAANIGLRLSLYYSTVSKPDLEAIIKNLTEKEEDLKGKLSNFDHYRKQGWVYFYHSFYYISSSEESWQVSRQFCLQRGADLLIINSKEEQDFARQFQKRTWIGLTDVATEGRWKWVDGTELKERYWVTGEPNSYEGNNEDCGEIRFYEKQYNWNDVPCIVRNFWICEKALAL